VSVLSHDSKEARRLRDTLTNDELTDLAKPAGVAEADLRANVTASTRGALITKIIGKLKSLAVLGNIGRAVLDYLKQRAGTDGKTLSLRAVSPLRDAIDIAFRHRSAPFANHPRPSHLSPLRPLPHSDTLVAPGVYRTPQGLLVRSV